MERKFLPPPKWIARLQESEGNAFVNCRQFYDSLVDKLWMMSAIACL